MFCLVTGRVRSFVKRPWGRYISLSRDRGAVLRGPLRRRRPRRSRVEPPLNRRRAPESQTKTRPKTASFFNRMLGPKIIPKGVQNAAKLE